MRKKFEERFIAVSDMKGNGFHTSYYYKKAYSLIFNAITIEEKGYLLSADMDNGDTIVTSHKHFEGPDTINEIIDFLNGMKSYLGLQRYSKKRCDTVIIYTDNLYKIYGFLKAYGAENVFGEDFGGAYYFKFLDVFEFRTFGSLCGNDDFEEYFDQAFPDDEFEPLYRKIAIFGNHLFKNEFIPNKKFYLTSTQIVLDRIKKAKKEDDIDLSELYPELNIYMLMKSAYFGGICHVEYPHTILPIENNQLITHRDSVSFYIYCLLAAKYPMSKFEYIKNKNFKKYENNKDYSYLVLLEVNTWDLPAELDFIKDLDGNKVTDQSIETTTICLTDVDFKLFKKYCPDVSYKLISVCVSKKGYLPKYLRKCLINEFLKKKALKGNISLYKAQKVILNAIYGAMVKKITDISKENKAPILLPQWGVWCTSYARSILLYCTEGLYRWLYSATDSMFYYTTPENEKLIDIHNEVLATYLKDACYKNDEECYYNSISDLGQFEIEHQITKFKANAKQQYMYNYLDKDCCEHFEIKASGYTGDKHDDSLYDSTINFGKRTYSYISDEETSRTIDGKLYTSKGYYWEHTTDDTNGDLDAKMDHYFRIVLRDNLTLDKRRI